MSTIISTPLSTTDLDLLLSLSDSELTSYLAQFPRSKRNKLLQALDKWAAKRVEQHPSAAPWRLAVAATKESEPWLPARHLLHIDRVVTETIYHNLEHPAEKRIVIVEAPARHGKSEYIVKYLPAWFLGKWPTKKVILACHTAGLAASYGKAVRGVLEQHGRDWFGIEVDDDKHAHADWLIQRFGGGMISAGIGGSITGRGAHLLLIDDPLKDSSESFSEKIRQEHWDWWQSTAATRREPGATTVIVATRWHADDLSGRLIKAAARGGTYNLVRVRLPAIAEEGDILGRMPGEALWPEYWPIESLEQTKRETDPYWWEAQYQQSPSGNLHTEWPDEYFGEDIWFDEWPDDGELQVKIVAVDPSLGKTDKSDFSAIVVLAKDLHGVYWVDADIRRRPSPQIVGDALLHHSNHRAIALGCEVNGFQELLRPMFEQEAGRLGVNCWFYGVHNGTNKIIRIKALAPILANKRLRFKRGSLGVQLLLEQLRGFPVVKHDDGPDALEMAIRLVEELLAGSVIREPEYEEQVVA